MEDKVRVYEIAEESGATSAEVITKAADLSIILKSPQTSVSFEQAEEIVNYIMTGKSKLLTKKVKKPTVVKKQKVQEKQIETKEESEDTKVKEVKKETIQDTTTKVEPKKTVVKKATLRRGITKVVKEEPVKEVVVKKDEVK